MKRLVFIVSLCVLLPCTHVVAQEIDTSEPVITEAVATETVINDDVIDDIIVEAEVVEESVASESYNYQKLDFNVFAGGLHIVKADMVLDYSDKDRYSMVFEAETRGILGSFAPWSGSFASKGQLLAERKLVPSLHESIAMWREEKEVKSYNYNEDGSFKDLVTLYQNKKPRTWVPSKELTDGTIDALTATMRVMEHVSDGGDCAGSAEVFDGRRRYNLVFKHMGFVTLKKSRHNAYSGVAAECSVEVVPVAGAWHKKPRGWLSIQEQGRKRGTMPTVWFAQVTENAVVVPVRVRVKTAYGTMFMHMTHYESGKTILTAKR